MNNKMKDNEFYNNKFGDEYQDIYNNIHASENLLRKVKKMKNDSENKRFAFLNKTTKIGYGLTALLAVFVLSNAGIYAATGETWIEKAYVSAMVDDQKQEAEAEKENFDVDEDNSSANSIYTADNDDILDSDEPDFVFENVDAQSLLSSSTTSEEYGVIYFCIGDQKIDITNDMENGKCTRTVEINGEKYTFTIEKGEDGVSISVTFDDDGDGAKVFSVETSEENDE